MRDAEKERLKDTSLRLSVPPLSVSIRTRVYSKEH